ncbi:MAG: aminoglycoside/choline kinase family phosphotransferase [Alteromonadaceae bacterium]|jgi:aminoglycoside/choline kinase family phosphotransferase
MLELTKWLKQHFSNESITLLSLTGDAGFRVYYRFNVNGQSFIAVDAPPKNSNNNAFIKMQQALNARGIVVPQIIAIDKQAGFFCLSDFGDSLFADTVNADNMVEQYSKAIDLLPLISSIEFDSKESLPVYDRDFIALELGIFQEWLLSKHLGIKLNSTELEQLSRCFELLINSALSQPQVTMHRDYHSRNIMMLADKQLGIIDFQDAVQGPITYDVVSLLRDCYIRWPQDEIDVLFAYFCQKMTAYYVLPLIDKSQWRLWFDLMGLQRHIKAAGIFARLFHRDAKDSYLKDIPLTLGYIIDISREYPELMFLNKLVKEQVLPAFSQCQLKNTGEEVL